MSRPGPVIAADGRTDTSSSAASLPRVRPSRAVVPLSAWDDPTTWGPHPDARGHQAPGVPPSPPAPVAGAVGLLPTGPLPAVAPALAPTVAASDPALLPVLAPRRDRPLTVVERVTLMLQRLGRGQGRHRTGHSYHHWSMFAPHTGPRRRPGWLRRRPPSALARRSVPQGNSQSTGSSPSSSR